MKKKIAGIPTYYWLIVIGVAILGLIFGGLFDYDLSMHLAYQVTGHGEWLARFMEGIGQLLGYCVIPIGATIIFSALLHDRPKWATAIGWACLIVGVGLSTYLYGKSLMDVDAFSTKMYIAYPLAFFLLGGASMLTFFLYGVKDKAVMLRVGIAIVAASLLHLAIVNGLKFMASRPRFRFIYSEGGSFVPWYQWNPFAYGLKTPDNYKSFPSGHAANTTMTLMLPTMVLVKGKSDGKYESIVVFWIAFAWALFMSFCRVLAGAHFLSDVSMGMLVGSVCCYLGYYIVLRKIKNPEYIKVDGMTIQKVDD
ncbi:MAG: phosphatase PAP2 family protein [Bacilli bacterium]|nr:phosphatase PAP2 family protein [Bacilli bacterium]